MQIIDTFQNRLKKAMEYRNIKQVDLVEKTKLDKTLINKYLSGVANAKQKKLAILAKALDVDEVWLMGYDTSMVNSTSTKLENNVVPINIFDGVVSDFNVLFPKNIIGTVDIEKSIINNGDNFFALKVKDDSMSPVFIENDIIVIKEQHDFENGDLVVAVINTNDITIKKVQKSDAGIVLQSFNPHYAPLFFTHSDIENLPVRIIGVVKQLRREF
jgi:hypothetical protein